MLNGERKNQTKTIPVGLIEGEKSPLHTYQEPDTRLTTIYCPECFAEQPCGKLKKGSKIPLEHEEGCVNKGH